MLFGTERSPLLKIDIGTIAALSDRDIKLMVGWGAMKARELPSFSAWLIAFGACELERRSDPRREPEMLSLPRLTATELSEFMQGTYAMVREVLNDQRAEFLDALHLLVIADTAVALETFEIQSQVVT